MARKSRKNIASKPTAQAAMYIRTAMYVRLSVEDNSHRGNSIENQQLVLNDYLAEKPELKVYDTYIDNGLSGTNFNRPSFQRMLSDIEAGQIDCVIVKDLSRLGRNFIDTSYYIEQYFFTRNIRFIAVTDQFDTANPDNIHGGIMLPLKNMINEAYALDIGKKIKAQQRQAMRDGEFVGGRAPYGYKKAPDNCHKLIIDEEPAKAVRQIFQWAYNNVAISEITRRLNDAGIATPSHYKQATGELKHQNLIGNGKWQTRTILRILDSPVYTGDLVQGRTKTVDHTQLRADTDNYITVRNTHEAIISHDIFDEVQRIRLQSRRECKEKPVNEYTPNIFKGKIFCAHCGKHLNRMCKRRITRADVYRFYCITNNRIAHGSCPGVSIREDELIPSVIAIMEKELSVALSDSLPTLKAEMTQQTERAEIQTQLSLKRQDLANSQRLIRGLYEDVVQGLLSSEDYFSMKEDYEQRVERLTAEITALNNRIVELNKQLSLYQDMHNDALTLESNHTLTAELIDRLIERIEVNHDKELTIVFRFQTDYAKVVTE